MGILRVLLAIIVIIFHTYIASEIFTLTDSIVAVEVFFMISGFYMAYVLSTKYKFSKEGIKAFFQSRFLRIFPLYWLILVLTIIAIIWYYFHFGAQAEQLSYIKTYVHDWSSLNLGQQILVVGSNLGIFFQDVTHFVSYGANKNLSEFLLVPQAWTLGIELTFYLAAPFFNRLKSKTIVVIILVSIATRSFVYSQGFHYDPWVNRFAFFELAFFLAGMLACRVYLKYPKIFERKLLTLISLIIVCLSLYSVLHLDYNAELEKWSFYLLTLLNLPFLFAFSNQFKWDRFIGELSYPIYITHLFVFLFIFQSLLPKLGDNKDTKLVIFTVLTLVFSLLSSLLITKVINRIKKRTKKVANG